MKRILGGIMAVIAACTLIGCGDGKVTEHQTTTSAVSVAQSDSLKEAFKDDFSVGVAINTWQLQDQSAMELIQKHFNSITMENEMKPENVLDWQGSETSSDGMPVINTENLDKVLSLAQEKGLPLRGHTLIWHNQTPTWFFCKDYDESKNYVDKKTMLRRMESYIKQVLEYCQNNYPGVVYAWDVLNEGVADSGGFREDSKWYETIGEDYFEAAFQYARKYAAEGVKLFYNDYNSYEIAKRDFIFAKVKQLKEKNLIDGVGMQSHWGYDYPDIDMIELAVEKFCSIEGIEVQLTEIDMHTTDNSEETMKVQAERYKEIFQRLLNLEKEGLANITNVTFWGLNDSVTWLTNFKGETSYPLLFDEDNKEKRVIKSLLELAAQN